MPKEIESEWLDARPRIVVSRCLGFDACRWNAEMIRDEFVESLQSHVDFVTFCPECEIGLGVPRRPIRLVAPDGSPRKEPLEMQSVQLVQPATASRRRVPQRCRCSPLCSPRSRAGIIKCGQKQETSGIHLSAPSKSAATDSMVLLKPRSQLK